MKDKKELTKEIEAKLTEAFKPFIGKRINTKGALTYEMLEAAAMKALEPYVHPCAEAHAWSPKSMAAKKGYCINCGAYLDLTRK